MKELDPLVFLAISREIFGSLLWPLLAIVLIGALAFVTLLIRERGVVTYRLLRSHVAGLLGGGLALVLMIRVFSAGFIDMGGPADWFLVALVFAAGMVGSAIILYTVVGWRSVCRGSC